MSEIFLRLPMYYLQPHEIVALAMNMGEKKWKKCEDEANRRWNGRPGTVRGVAYGAEVRATIRKNHPMRPPAEWLKEAGVDEDSLRRALKVLSDD